MKEIVLDTETTGLSVRDGHRIVEIGCIELDNLVPTKNIFHFYLNPERKVSEKAFEVHGYTDEFLSNKHKFAEIADDFLDFINFVSFEIFLKLLPKGFSIKTLMFFIDLTKNFFLLILIRRFIKYYFK